MSLDSPSFSTAESGRVFVSPEARWNFWFVLICSQIFLLGILLRAAYVYWWHWPPESIYSDMQGYVGTARAWFSPGYQFGPKDTFQAPGYHMMLGWLLHWNPSMVLAVTVQFLMSCAIPAMLAAIAWQLYGRSVALVTLAVSSLYWPFIDYTGYFLSEIPFLFTMLLSMLLLVSAIRTQHDRLSWAWALLSGLTLGLAAAIKPAVLIGALLILMLLAGAAWKHRWARLRQVLITSVVGMILYLIPFSIRATRLNDGEFVLISTNGPMNMQQGHAGENVSGIRFTDPQGRGVWQWGSPTVNHKAQLYREEMDRKKLPIDPLRFQTTNYFNCAPWDRDVLRKAIRDRIREAPLEVFAQSCNNVYETLFTSPPWPSFWAGRPWGTLTTWSERFFRWFILLPAFLELVVRRRAFRDKQGPGLADGLMALPFFGLLITVFLATPEARYRIPFDAFAIVLAARFYTLGASRPDGLVPPDTLIPLEILPEAALPEPAP